MHALLDLLFPARCVGCDTGGAVVCARCRALLHGPALERPPTPCPAGMPVPYAVAAYSGAVRNLVLGYKEHEALALTVPLAAALAAAIDAATAAAAHRPAASERGDRLVVPVPSAPAARRRRGFDPVTRLARHARAGLVLTALEHSRAVDDSAGLSARQRQLNLAGALRVRPAMAEPLRGRTVVLVDDVVTTGATLTEAARALRAAGAQVRSAAVIAATARGGTA